MQNYVDTDFVVRLNLPKRNKNYEQYTSDGVTPLELLDRSTYADSKIYIYVDRKASANEAWVSGVPSALKTACSGSLDSVASTYNLV